MRSPPASERCCAGRVAFTLAAQRHVAAMVAAWCLTVTAGCEGPQSALDPAGRGASQLADLFWVMAVGGALIWCLVVGLGVYTLLRPESGSRRKAGLYIIGGGVLFPTIVLTLLLSYGLALLPDLVAPPPEGSLRIRVSGLQWWWRVDYPVGDGTVSLANELHLPVGEPVEIRLLSEDVIHSFWVPSLGGKVDMIPGRETRLTLHPTRTGVFRGACAEYCGASHALMNFNVVVEEREDFDRWLAAQAAEATEPSAPLAREGRDLFLSQGCGACHTVRGTEAQGKFGPDLTHVGSRTSLAAGVLPNTSEAFRRWITRPDAVKPGALMPHFGMLSESELKALSAYLETLQ